MAKKSDDIYLNEGFRFSHGFHLEGGVMLEEAKIIKPPVKGSDVTFEFPGFRVMVTNDGVCLNLSPETINLIRTMGPEKDRILCLFGYPKSEEEAIAAATNPENLAKVEKLREASLKVWPKAKKEEGKKPNEPELPTQ